MPLLLILFGSHFVMPIYDGARALATNALDHAANCWLVSDQTDLRMHFHMRVFGDEPVRTDERLMISHSRASL